MEEYEYIKGYEGRYKINRGGSIWSCIYRKEMKPILNEDGYLTLSLTNEERVRRKCFISRLLAIQYIPNEDPTKIQIDHIDRNKLNNSLDNLRWVSQQENLKNKVRNGSIYEDVRKDGKSYWKGCYYWYREDGTKKQEQKTSINREVVEKWLEEQKLLH